MTYNRKYAVSLKRKEARLRYNQSEKGRAVNNAQSKRWRKANPEKYAASLRKHDLKRHYSLTPEQVKNIFTSQGYRCGACGSTSCGRRTGHWCIDHDHKTGRVRGILCNGCNMALGHAKDNPATLRLLADYLERKV